VQDVFVEALKGLSKLNDESKVKQWLSAVTVRVAMRRLRRRKIALVIGLGQVWQPSWLTAPAVNGEQRVMLEQIFRVLEQVSVNERVAWSLRHLQGEPLEEVALLCRCSLATAKRRIAVVQSLVAEALDE
jgi:RNA polymerase sigma-70 factor, ECF subfamily